jgi:hypothetical protein
VDREQLECSSKSVKCSYTLWNQINKCSRIIADVHMLYSGKGYPVLCQPAPEEGTLDIIFESGEESVDPLNSQIRRTRTEAWDFLSFSVSCLQPRSQCYLTAVVDTGTSYMVTYKF